MNPMFAPCRTSTFASRKSLLDGTDPLICDSLKDREIFDLLGYE